MTGDQSLQPFRSGRPAPRQPGAPATRATSTAPVHRPGAVDWTESVASREDCWQRLSPGVRGRVDQRVGRVLDWWATDLGGRVGAVVFGTRALVAVTPTVNAAGQPAYELVTVHLAEQSFRSVVVRGASPTPGGQATGATPGGPPFGSSTPVGGSTPVGSGPIGSWPGGSGPGGSGPGGSGPGGSGPGGGGTADLGLGPEFTAVLGLLPARAQQLLQDPFLTGPRPLRGDWYVSYAGNPAGLGGAVVRLWCYLTDERSLTFCSGVGHGYRDGAGARSWEATCWRATTLTRAEAANR
ncbi:hypothetical protein O7606_03975 [Micromonospora sp. WMMD882]|uniref:hypothetical protein n=1 Tax=Micromonospora sp. WMMD882 TaxID=3015151 RepID=UPI00248CC924|nr:hypothetical protein [Micromonospora sp. WMMD882]WBB80555.1 hypothetical protein O7606_03975 [Micromonospora sp. WMMD882]